MAYLSEQLRDFITRHIFSLEQLEILLLLRSDPETRWNAVNVAKALALQPDSVAARLADLRARGFIDEIDVDPPNTAMALASRSWTSSLRRIALSA